MHETARAACSRFGHAGHLARMCCPEYPHRLRFPSEADACPRHGVDRISEFRRDLLQNLHRLGMAALPFTQRRIAHRRRHFVPPNGGRRGPRRHDGLRCDGSRRHRRRWRRTCRRDMRGLRRRSHPLSRKEVRAALDQHHQKDRSRIALIQVSGPDVDRWRSPRRDMPCRCTSSTRFHVPALCTSAVDTAPEPSNGQSITRA